MLLFLACLAAAAAAPASYDQRQDGDFNVRADVQNVVLLFALPQKMSMPSSLLDGFLKNVKPARDIQERSDMQVMEAFVEPSTPYRVEIGSGERFESDGRAVEVVIAGRRRASEPEDDSDEIRLLGASEQCGPDSERDRVTLICRARKQKQPEPEPEPKPDAQVEVQPEVLPEIQPEVVLASS